MKTGDKKSRFGLIGLAIAAIGLVISLVVFLLYRKGQVQTSSKIQVEPKPEVEERTPEGLTYEDQLETFTQIKDYIMSQGWREEVALALAGASAHETGRWSSQLATMYNALFGMKSGGAGTGIPNGSAAGFATYDSYESSIDDVLAWFLAKGYPKDEEMKPENVIQWMKSKKYFEDTLTNYRTSVLSLISEFNT